MKPIHIRDLETGQVLERFGATAQELLMSREPERDEDGNTCIDDEGQIVYSDKRRFCRVGAEPRLWKEAQAAKLAQAAPVDTPDPDDTASRRRGRKRGEP